MSYVYNMIYGFYGGGGGLSASDAILSVITPSGSTVTATKGGISLTPTLWTTAADATQECALFVISAAQFDASTPWTVTATDGTYTASDTIIIDSNKQYEMLIDYKVWFVKHGVVITTFTTSSYAILNQTTAYTQMKSSGNNYAYITTQNQFDVTDFTALRLKLVKDIDGYYGQSYYSTAYPTIGVGSSTPSSDSDPNYNISIKMNSTTGQIPNETYTVDLSSQSGLKYVSMFIAGSSFLTRVYGYANIYDFYLDR